jgi:hypothetical protein
LAKIEPCRDLSSLQRPQTAHLNHGNARKLRVIRQRLGNGGSYRTAWWSREDSKCVPGTQSYRTGLCEAASGLARLGASPGAERLPAPRACEMDLSELGPFGYTKLWVYSREKYLVQIYWALVAICSARGRVRHRCLSPLASGCQMRRWAIPASTIAVMIPGRTSLGDQEKANHSTVSQVRN